MPQQDFLLRQIQLMGVFLQKLISRLLKKDDNEHSDEVLETVKTEFKNELGWNLDELVVLGKDDFFVVLDEKNFTEAHLESLARIFFIMGQTNEGKLVLQKQNYLQKALEVYEKLEQESGNFSFERNQQILLIKQMQNR